MLGMDALLSTHPTLRLERWIDFAYWRIGASLCGPVDYIELTFAS